ncbi:MAG TPA: hypothetical protein VFG55_07940 [Rhodanobacteraceae bacterium]|nr:hypothetical protein [Rhodanobacteraceae bacterium]
MTMKTWRSVLVALLLISAPITANAGQLVIPCDVSVGLDASPQTGLLPGDLVTFTVSATNNGPEPVSTVALSSSHIIDQFDLGAATVDCSGLGLVVADSQPPYYYYDWYPTMEVVLAVGETRLCVINLPITRQAPATMSFSFSIPSFFVDLDPSNNSATVILHRADAAVAAIPVLSTAMLFLLAGLLAMAAGNAHLSLPGKLNYRLPE